MMISIEVTPPMDSQEVSFEAVRLRRDCEQGLLSIPRNPVTDQYTLRSLCGLEITPCADAKKDITLRAIDAQIRTLDFSYAQADYPSSVTVFCFFQ